jgi:hypothetical protein
MVLFEGDQKEERRLKPFFFMNFLHSMVEEMKTHRDYVYMNLRIMSLRVYLLTLLNKASIFCYG